MHTFCIPTKEDVSPLNKKYFDYFNDKLGIMPNLYAMLALSDTALDTYVRLQSRKQLLTIEEKEVISLVVGAFNESAYCLQSHAMIASLNGFSEQQIGQIKAGTAAFDLKYDTLARLTHSMMLNRCKPEESTLDQFFAMGYTNAHLVDVVLCIGANMISNMLTRTMNVPLDNPPEISI
ncbi:carboxymuconolactone decarboxylase family protein [Chitinophaga sp. S165]|uniref:carboxymuconolactone decarboxylase family protein n=1 Tax=Chitinophaga sp. S165 TaxID=2135462 RepID=UPI000D718154|nr:carboxymuconolactone decarboxylase family protein [Chitinophaga sp. S165]PWV53981.1 AhpD family alkylhydroperoxidase [Chitinophaga sp. S165]